MHKVDWINVFSGVVLTVFVTSVLPRIYGLFTTIVNDKYRSYYGSYYMYNWHAAGESKIIQKTLSVRKSIFGKPKVRIDYEDDENRDYKGTFYISRSLLVMDLEGVSHKESLRVIFHEPINSCLSPSIGIISGSNIHRNPASGKTLVSSTKIDIDEVKIALGENSTIVVNQAEITKLRYDENKPIKMLQRTR